MEYWQIQELMTTLGIILVVLIPVTGLTLRFGVRPFLKDFAEFRAIREGKAQIQPPDERLERIEQQLDDLEGSVKRLADVAEFDRQLESRPEKSEGRTP
jgi:hypothetical protein